MLHSPDFFRLAMYFYLVASLLYIVNLVFKFPKVGISATVVNVLGFLLQTAAIGLRWKESYAMGYGHIPLSNMFESMVFFAWSIVAVYLYFELRYKTRALGAVVTPLAFIAIASVSISPYISQEIEPLVPALKSNWLTIHVGTSFFGYAAFAVSFAMSVVFLLLSSDDVKEFSYWISRLAIPAVIATLSVAFPDTSTKIIICLVALFVAGVLLVMGGPKRKVLLQLFPDAKVMDDINYKSIMVGFPMLTLGIITGAAWANYAWGSYWSWDPKETWSLITWFVYAAFLHARFTAGWRGKKAALLAIVGFGFVIFTYIGVNFLLSGLHSYGSN